MYELKAYYRRRFLEERLALPASLVEDLSGRIAAHVIRGPLFTISDAVVLYSAADNEPATEEIRAAAEIRGKMVYYPRVGADRGAMDFVRVLPGESLHESAWGIGEPSGRVSFQPGKGTSTLVIVPGLGFDRTGTRLGRGGGYYDRVLRRLTAQERIVALAFSFQLVPSLPRTVNDVPVESVIVETGTVNCGAVRVERFPIEKELI